jgi:hypothetical protein
MKSLTRVTGDSLTLIFSPEGALSSARLNGQNVASEISYVRETDCETCLDVFGFRKEWDPSEVDQFSKISDRLREHGLQVFNVMLARENQYTVFLCELKDPAHIHKTTKAVLLFDVTSKRFLNVVRLFDMKSTACQKILSENWR